MELLDNPAVLAPVVSLLTVVLTKLFEYYVLGKKLRSDDATLIRQELRLDIGVLKTDLDLWKGKYYTLQEENNDLKLRNRELSADLEDAKSLTAELREEVDTLTVEVKALRKKVGNGDTF